MLIKKSLKFRKELFLLSLGLFFISFFSFSQTTSNDSLTNVNSEIKIDKMLAKSFIKDFPKVVISPIHWSRNEWIGAASLFAFTGFAYSKDEEIMKFVQKNKSPNFTKVNEYFFDPYGKGYYTLPLMAGVCVYGFIGHHEKAKAVSLDFFKATAYAGLIATVIKHVAHRNRPFQTTPYDPYIWDGPIGDISYTSFPSGHTLMAFTFASVVSEHYKDKIWVPISLYSLATLEAYARMGAEKHWASDVLIGGALGYAVGTWVVHNSSTKYMLSPWASQKSVGASLLIPINK